MIESLIVYNSLLIILPFLGKIAINSYNSKGLYSHYNYQYALFLIIFFFVIIFGLRGGVGIDYYSYKETYDLFLSGFNGYDSGEGGYILICRFLSTWGFPSYIFFSFFCTIQITCIIMAFRRSNLLPFVLVVLIMTQFMVMMTLVRQMTFVCIFIWVVSRIEKINIFKYALIICLSTFFFHKSALLMLVVYPIIKYRRNLCGSVIFQIVIFTIFVIIGYSQILIHAFENLDFIANALGYDRYAGYNVLSGMFMDPNWGARTYVRLFLMYAAIIFSDKVRKENSNSSFNRFYNLFFWGVCMEMMLYGTNVASRAFLPMYYMKLVIYAYTLQYLYLKFKRRHMLVGFICFFSLLLFDYSTIYYEALNPDANVAYRFFWQLN